MHIQKILLVQLYSNGDCLYATAVARQIKEDFPRCHLTWMIAGFCNNIINENPYVDAKRVADDIRKNDLQQFLQLSKQVTLEKEQGLWDEVFILQNSGNNFANYDGTIRGMIFRAYPRTITVPVQPVLVLTDAEKNNATTFAQAHQLSRYSNVILWEFAPQSGQLKLDFNQVMTIAQKITSRPDTCIILSSANRFNASDSIFDASSLSFRENAALTHYCTLLIGCSSGITWISTSSAAKMLPMVQLLDDSVLFLNAPSVDFKRFGMDTSGLIEMTRFSDQTVSDCIEMILKEGMEKAKTTFHEELPIQFHSTKRIVYNLLCYLQFKAIWKHWRINTGLYGLHPVFIRQFILGFIAFPYLFLTNKWRKRNG